MFNFHGGTIDSIGLEPGLSGPISGDSGLPTKYPDFTISNDLILRKGHIWLPLKFPFLSTLLTEYHATPTGGHLGITKTTIRLVEFFYWEGLWDDVTKFVTSHLDCQHAKYET